MEQTQRMFLLSLRKVFCWASVKPLCMVLGSTLLTKQEELNAMEEEGFCFVVYWEGFLMYPISNKTIYPVAIPNTKIPKLSFAFKRNNQVYIHCWQNKYPNSISKIKIPKGYSRWYQWQNQVIICYCRQRRANTGSFLLKV